MGELRINDEAERTVERAGLLKKFLADISGEERVVLQSKLNALEDNDLLKEARVESYGRMLKNITVFEKMYTAAVKSFAIDKGNAMGVLFLKAQKLTESEEGYSNALSLDTDSLSKKAKVNYDISWKRSKAQPLDAESEEACAWLSEADIYRWKEILEQIGLLTKKVSN